MRKSAIGLLALLVSAPAMGEPIPASILEKDRRNCVAGRTGNVAAETYCMCFVLTLYRDMTLQEYLTVEGEMRNKIASGQTIQVATSNTPELVRALRSCGAPR